MTHLFKKTYGYRDKRIFQPIIPASWHYVPATRQEQHELIHQAMALDKKDGACLTNNSAFVHTNNFVEANACDCAARSYYTLQSHLMFKGK